MLQTTAGTGRLSEIAGTLDIETCQQTPSAFLEAARSWLAQPHDWAAIVADYMQSLDDQEFIGYAHKGAIADSVPRVILLHEYCNGDFQIVLHHFESPLWYAHFKAGRFRPHHHSRPFAVRLLSGGYRHLTFRPETDSVKLTPVHETVCRPGDLYALSPKTYHFVAMPEHDTLTLSVRGRVEEELDISADSRFDRETLLAYRSYLLALLHAAPRPIPLRTWDFEAIVEDSKDATRPGRERDLSK